LNFTFINFFAMVKDETYFGTVDKNLCISCGDCWTIDPVDFFEDNDGKANVRNPITNEQMFKAAQSACPVGAIWSNF